MATNTEPSVDIIPTESKPLNRQLNAKLKRDAAVSVSIEIERKPMSEFQKKCWSEFWREILKD